MWQMRAYAFSVMTCVVVACKNNLLFCLSQTSYHLFLHNFSANVLTRIPSRLKDCTLRENGAWHGNLGSFFSKWPANLPLLDNGIEERVNKVLQIGKFCAMFVSYMIQG